MLITLTRTFAAEAQRLTASRPLLALAGTEAPDALMAALDAEVRVEMAKDRAYWEPLKRELETMRIAQAREGRS